MKKTKEIPKIIYDMLMDINIDKDFRIKMAKELKIEMPFEVTLDTLADDHLEDIKNDFDLSMFKETDDSARYEQEEYINHLEGQNE